MGKCGCTARCKQVQRCTLSAAGCSQLTCIPALHSFFIGGRYKESYTQLPMTDIRLRASAAYPGRTYRCVFAVA